MAVEIQENEVIDLDFTYGEEFVHFATDSMRKRGVASLCGAPRSTDHMGHWGVNGLSKVPRECSCGAPVCPVCRYIAKHEVSA